MLPTTQEMTVHAHRQLANAEVRQTVSLRAGDGEAVFSLPKQDQEQTMVLTTNCEKQTTK